MQGRESSTSALAATSCKFADIHGIGQAPPAEPDDVPTEHQRLWKA
jgi:hypothetical protein